MADTPEKYLAIAAAQRNDLESLARLRSGLRQRIVQSPLCDATRFAANLEAALRRIWRRWCESQR